MDEFVKSYRPFADLLGFVNGLVLTAIFAYGLQQVRLTKRGLKTRNERAAKEHAIEYSSRWLNTYVPLETEFLDEWIAANLRIYDGPIGDWSSGSIPAGYRQNTDGRLQLRTWLPQLNELLAISSAFISGVADEETGFGIIGRSFCADIEDKYDLVSYYRKEVAHPVFQPIVDLYRIWRPRLSRAEMEAARTQLDLRIAAIPREEPRPHIGEVE